ncbi:MAG: ATPase domain-containing protein [Candidatus Thermoplasmatota archaeon]|nr:ATPase domain-containing protein [Candidatus Thermoplasmatota archaeon]
MDVNEGEINFGITQLDNLSLGSLKPGSMGLFYGNVGTGKSSFLAHFLFKGADMDSNVCLLTNEPPGRIATRISSFETCRPNWLKDGYISIFSIRDLAGLIGVDLDRPSSNDIDLFLDLILQSLDHLDAKRLVIDPFNPLLRILDDKEKTFFLQKLKDGLQTMGVTAFLGLDMENGLSSLDSKCLEPNLFDAIIRFSKEKEPPVTLNTFTIERWKGSPHAMNTYVIDVSNDGIILIPRIKPLEVR